MWWGVAAVWLLFILIVVFQPVYRIGDWWLNRRASRQKAGKEAATTGAARRARFHIHWWRYDGYDYLRGGIYFCRCGELQYGPRR